VLKKGGEIMKLAKWEPFKEIGFLKKSIDRLFDEFFTREPLELSERGFGALDVVEENDRFLIKVDLPGFNKNDIKVNLDDNILTIECTREEEKTQKEKNYLRTERFYGKFSRSVSLPNTIDANRISAEYKNGVLTLNLPKKEEARPKTIDIKID
jgi:HSP20 family protein